MGWRRGRGRRRRRGVDGWMNEFLCKYPICSTVTMENCSVC
jgi:hypothetical protein